MSYTQNDYEKTVEEIKALSHEKYKDFHRGLVPGITNVYGVTVPNLRLIAKQIAKADYNGFLSVAQDNSYEEIMVQGMVIGLCKCDVETRQKLIKAFVPKIKNWAVCDVFCTGLKAVKKEPRKFRDFLNEYLNSDEEFFIRFGVVMLMSYYTGDEYIENTLQVLNKIKHSGYYVQMAVAWALSVCFIKQRDKALALFLDNNLDDFTFNKTLQKCRESYRVTADDKQLLIQLKRKKCN